MAILKFVSSLLKGRSTICCWYFINVPAVRSPTRDPVLLTQTLNSLNPHLRVFFQFPLLSLRNLLFLRNVPIHSGTVPSLHPSGDPFNERQTIGKNHIAKAIVFIYILRNSRAMRNVNCHHPSQIDWLDSFKTILGRLFYLGGHLPNNTLTISHVLPNVCIISFYFSPK